MPSSQLSIILHNPVAVYFPGQTISGHVLYNTVANERCRGITVEIRGSGSVFWKERIKDRIIRRRASEEYYSLDSQLLGGTADTELSPGTHRYDFSFVLPRHSPNSFEGTYGNIRHFCRASVQFPSKDSKACCVIYSVNSILDLNLDQSLLMPVEESQTKYVCCICWLTGPISFKLQLDRTGFVPGEPIRIEAECANMSSRACVAKARILQIIKYKAGDCTRKEIREVASAKHPAISRGQLDVWSGPELYLPPVPPSNLNNCSLMTIMYIFQFKLDISGSATMDTNIPIAIGTIPLQHTFSQMTPLCEDQALPTTPSAPYLEEDSPGDPEGSGGMMPHHPPPYEENPSGYVMPRFPGLEAYPNLCPPSYEESVSGIDIESPEGEVGPQGAEDPEGADGVSNSAMFSRFTPRYVSYGRSFRTRRRNR